MLRNVDARGTANFAGTLLQFRAVPEVTLENCTLGDNLGGADEDVGGRDRRRTDG